MIRIFLVHKIKFQWWASFIDLLYLGILSLKKICDMVISYS